MNKFVLFFLSFFLSCQIFGQITYNGDPKWKLIEGTSIYEAENSSTTVLYIREHYYAIESGNVYESDLDIGPWRVCVNIPKEVNDNIHHTKVLTTIKEQTVFFPMKDNKIFYQRIKALDSTFTSDQLYSKSKFFISENYKSSNDVIKLDDKINGIIMVKGAFHWKDDGVDYMIYHTLKIFTKDSKYKIEASDFHSKISWPGNSADPRGFSTDCDLESLHNYIHHGMTQGWSKKIVLNVYLKVDLLTKEILDRFQQKMLEEDEIRQDW